MNDSPLYSDNHLLVAVKPAGWLTQPDGSSTPDLETLMKEWVKKEKNKPGAVFLHAAHRLDRFAFGLVLFARTSKALSRLNEQMRAGTIRRIYVAEVEGTLIENEGVLEHYLTHEEYHAAVVAADHPGAKKARLSYVVEERLKTSTMVRVDLATGRYHQIRAQFSAIGHPILGDTRYGAKEEKEKSHLQCATLIFQHPVTKEKKRFDH
jgi:23S rRNA pseudouridine1911/1915/1917 synthase